MLREHSNLFTTLHKLLDLGLTGGAFIAAYFIKRLGLPGPLGGLSTEPNYYIVLLLILIIWSVSLSQFNVYASLRPLTLEQVLRNVFKAVLVSFLVLVVCLYLLRISNVSRLLLGIFLCLDLLILSASKAVLYRLLRHYRQQGYNIRNILVVGTRSRARAAIESINRYRETGYRIMGCLDVDPALKDQEVVPGIKVLGAMADLPGILREQVVDEVVFAMPLKKIEEAHRYIGIAEFVGVNIRIVPDWQLDKIMYSPAISRVNFEEFLGVITMTLSATPPQRVDLALKQLFDYLFAGVMLVLLAPLFLVLAAAIKLASPGGPIFFRQTRCGENGRLFPVYKFRTMVPDAERKRQELAAANEADGPVFKIKDDPRIIPGVGTLLRKTSLDELPQLINILKGEMSLIGPRPPIPHEVDEYDIWQRRRLSMKPGITCLWQITPNRNEVSFQEWMELDLAYIDNWSLTLDAEIFWKTVMVMLFGMGR